MANKVVLSWLLLKRMSNVDSSLATTIHSYSVDPRTCHTLLFLCHDWGALSTPHFYPHWINKLLYLLGLNLRLVSWGTLCLITSYFPRRTYRSLTVHLPSKYWLHCLYFFISLHTSLSAPHHMLFFLSSSSFQRTEGHMLSGEQAVNNVCWLIKCFLGMWDPRRSGTYLIGPSVPNRF